MTFFIMEMQYVLDRGQTEEHRMARKKANQARAEESHGVTIKSGSRGQAVITVRSNGHTQKFTVPRSPLVKQGTESPTRSA